MSAQSTSKPVGPVTAPETALGDVRAALTQLRGSESYKQYQANGTLARTKLGACEQALLAAVTKLGG